MIIIIIIIIIINYKGTQKATSLNKKCQEFCTLLPKECLSRDLVPLWPFPQPHPGQSCLVGITNDSVGLQHCFFLGEGEQFVVAITYKSFILKLDIFVHDCRISIFGQHLLKGEKDSRKFVQDVFKLSNCFHIISYFCSVGNKNSTG